MIINSDSIIVNDLEMLSTTVGEFCQIRMTRKWLTSHFHTESSNAHCYKSSRKRTRFSTVSLRRHCLERRRWKQRLFQRPAFCGGLEGLEPSSKEDQPQIHALRSPSW